MDFAIGLVNSVFNLFDEQVMFFEEFESQKNCEINSAHQKAFEASWNDDWASKCYNQLRKCWDTWPGKHSFSLKIAWNHTSQRLNNSPLPSLFSMLLLENFSMISYCDQLWEGRGRGLKRVDLISTLDVQIRYNVSSLFATGCSFSLPEKQAVKRIFFAPCLELTSGKQIELVTLICLTVLAHLLLSRQFSNLSASFLHFPKGARRS